MDRNTMFKKIAKDNWSQFVRNLNRIKDSQYYDLFLEMMCQVSSADNFSEAWGGIRYYYIDGKCEALEKEIQELIDSDTPKMDNFIYSPASEVFDILIQRNIISIEGYEL